MRFVPVERGVMGSGGGPPMLTEGVLLAPNPHTRFLDRLFEDECAVGSRPPCIARLSIALGALEAPLTVKKDVDQAWPEDLEGETARLLSSFSADVAALAPALEGAGDTRGRICQVADWVWSRISKGGFSKDLLHCATVYSFAQTPPGKKCKLDCAGTTTTVLAACQLLGGDLARTCMLLSEDHCLVGYREVEGGELHTVEVTADTKEKRGRPVLERELLAAREGGAAWVGEAELRASRSWLYLGGGGLVECGPFRTVAALLNNINPSIVSRQNTGIDSVEMGLTQLRLLRFLREKRPEAMYPMSLCTLGDLEEICAMETLKKAVEAGDAGAVAAALEGPAAAEEALQAAVAMADPRPVAMADPRPVAMADPRPVAMADPRPVAMADPRSSAQCYPSSYLAHFYKRRAAALRLIPAALLPPSVAARPGGAEAAAWEVDKAALQSLAAGSGALASYRLPPGGDPELHRDTEGGIEGACDILAARHKRLVDGGGEGLVEGGKLGEAAAFSHVLALLDAACAYHEGQRPPPAEWVARVLRAAGLFGPSARAEGGGRGPAGGGWRSAAMRAAAPMWAELKLGALRPVFEAVGGEGGADGTSARGKRRRT